MNIQLRGHVESARSSHPVQKHLEEALAVSKYRKQEMARPKLLLGVKERLAERTPLSNQI